MTSVLLMVQGISQNIALFCCALFAGGSVYVSLVEDPATTQGGTDLAGTYLLAAHPRPAIFQASFAALAALSGLLTGLTGGSAWWIVGGGVLGIAALMHLYVIVPATRGLVSIDPALESERASRLVAKLKRLHAALSLLSLAGLFIFIMKT